MHIFLHSEALKLMKIKTLWTHENKGAPRNEGKNKIDIAMYYKSNLTIRR